MMRAGILVLLLICLLSRGPLAGLAQEAVTSGESDLHTRIPTSATVTPFATLSDLLSSSSSVPEFLSIIPGVEESERVTVTGSSEASPAPSVSESSTIASPIIKVSQETATDRTGTTISLPTSNPEIRDTTGPNLAQPTVTTHTSIISVTEEATTGSPSSLTESPPPLSTVQPPATQTPLATGTLSDTTQPTTQTSWISTITTSLRTTSDVTSALPTDPATPPRPHSTRAQGQRGIPVLKVGEKEAPSFPPASSSNPIFVMIVSVFTIVVVMVVVIVGFRRYKKRNRRTEFRRLQDLPMDDMMEDTPLSLYSY